MPLAVGHDLVNLSGPQALLRSVMPPLSVEPPKCAIETTAAADPYPAFAVLRESRHRR